MKHMILSISILLATSLTIKKDNITLDTKKPYFEHNLTKFYISLKSDFNIKSAIPTP
jgi:hypothetical protein